MEFVENWDLISTLGEGAYGEVQLLLNRQTGESVAMKTVDLEKHKSAVEDVKKEIFIHKRLSHENIIQFYGDRNIGSKHLIFLEYAPGGVLFDRIEPDFGMPLHEVQSFMKQLLSGVAYLHSKGIAHRDIKPENLLISTDDTLKISDFGLATFFRLKNSERMLQTRCGTLPYVAPEVYTGSYAAIPADLWSCGIVFIAMLTGELPWHEPTEDYPEYGLWKNDNYIMQSPWRKLDNNCLNLAKIILNPNPKNRPSIRKVLSHPWMQANLLNKDFDDALDGPFNIRNVPEVVLSQPIPHVHPPNPTHIADLLKAREQPISFSQPVENEDLFIPSQITFTQTVLKKNDFQHLVKRMTRFFVKTDVQKTITSLCCIFDKLGYIWSADVSCVITISTVDSRKTSLIFKANILEMEDKILVDFRLSKGCGLEFKRRFVKIKSLLTDIVVNK